MYVKNWESKFINYEFSKKMYIILKYGFLLKRKCFFCGLWMFNNVKSMKIID